MLDTSGWVTTAFNAEITEAEKKYSWLCSLYYYSRL